VRRGSIVQLLLFSLVAGGIATAVALLLPWLPTSASQEAGRIDFVYWFVTVICIAIFSVVAAVIVYSVVKFRAAPDDDSDGPPIHGHTALEIWWTAIPAVLVTAIAIVSAVVLARDDAKGANPLTVDVTAQQFAWSFKYPNGTVSGDLRLPRDRQVVLRLHALDVIHSFWVPEFRQKQDAVPGIVTTVKITPTRLGVYPVICTELCGPGHSLMRSSAVVMPPAGFESWLSGQGKALGGAPAGAGKAVFAANGCDACHTLSAAGAKGTVGPDLDKLPAYATKAGKPLTDFIRESIVKPDAYVQPGYPPHVMPATYGSQLSKTQLDGLVTYLVDSSKGTAK
jgi:cytochrome c oxidase subunit 2